MNFSYGKMKVTLVTFFTTVTFYAVLAIFILVFAITSCSRSSSRSNTGTALHSESTGIKRIISAAPSNTEIIIGLGLGGRLIAVDLYSRDIAGVPESLPLIDFFYPDAEAIIGLEPDMILVNEINSFGVADNPFKLLGDLGINVLQVPTSNSIEGIYSDILMIAEALDVKDRGQALVDSMKDEIKNITEANEKMFNQTANRKTVYFEISSMPTMVTFGEGAYLNEMIEIAGGKNIFAEQRGWFSAGAEEIINRNPDIIFTLVYSGEDAVSEIKNRRSFESINAVRTSQVYAIDADSASRPSQHILRALREMAKAINPDYETAH